MRGRLGLDRGKDTDRGNPHGGKAITSFSLSFYHRSWVTRMPVLRTADGTEFDKTRKDGLKPGTGSVTVRSQAASCRVV